MFTCVDLSRFALARAAALYWKCSRLPLKLTSRDRESMFILSEVYLKSHPANWKSITGASKYPQHKTVNETELKPKCRCVKIVACLCCTTLHTVRKAEVWPSLLKNCPYVVDKNAPKYSRHYQLSMCGHCSFLYHNCTLHHNYQPAKECWGPN